MGSGVWFSVVCGMAAMVSGCGKEAPPASAAAQAPAPAKLPAVASMDDSMLTAWAEKGKQVWAAKTCFLCHSLNGAPLIGPSPFGVWGSMQKLEDGREVQVDEAYIRESILDPGAKITAGYPNQMLPFKDHVTDEDLTALAALFRSLKDVKPAPQGLMPALPTTGAGSK